ncbi:MAG: helix-turn-helix domain-containing protein [Luteitalea sp.]|nr:helix-turn-helix domain-containing protein [Luteitalea sp.]
MMGAVRPAGDLLREWRQRRRLSQLDLACEADISTRHLSFLETGRSQPSREMVLHLAERLDVPLRERNTLLMAAGYAPVFPERPLDDPALLAARRAIDVVLAGHEPYPALAVDRHWTLIASNAALSPLLAGVEPSLLQPPVNVLRVSLHPEGCAPRIVNLSEWRLHVFERLRRQIDLTGDPLLVELLGELHGYHVSDSAEAARPSADRDYAGVVVPLQIRTNGGTLSFFSTTTIFGTPIDITLSELAIESFFPADTATAEALRAAAATRSKNRPHDADAVANSAS